jgi:hypothetical protein
MTAATPAFSMHSHHVKTTVLTSAIGGQTIACSGECRPRFGGALSFPAVASSIVMLQISSRQLPNSDLSGVTGCIKARTLHVAVVIT